ncbi:hypothetical protein [Alienimonas sp. DA493]|uniref:hypothetical protein n=1 Tax=Alienimonas sp. DA493 TaxID=3373605 RepID=UPI00375481C5
MPGPTLTAAWADRVADAVPFARRLPGFGVLTGPAGAPPPPPAPFSLPCRCGAVVTGMRSEREREEPCLNCGEPHFVLPADVYPAAPERSPAAAKTKRQAARERTQTPATPAAAPAAPRVPWRTRLATAARRQVTPLRLIAVGLTAVVALTTWWGVVQSRRAAARVTIAEAPAAAEEALAAGQFALAAERFDALAAAYETLGRAAEPRARAARQQARETTAVTGLAALSPAELARQAAAARTPADRTAWRQTYDALYRGRWVILDAFAARVAAPAAPPAAEGEDDTDEPAGRPAPPAERIELLYPLAAGKTRFRLIGDPAVPGDLSVGDAPRRAVLAGRYGDFVLLPAAGEGRDVWELRLEPGSAFLWTGPETLAAVGFDLSDPDGAAVRALLARQAADLGLEPRTDDSPADDPPAAEAAR